MKLSTHGRSYNDYTFVGHCFKKILLFCCQSFQGIQGAGKRNLIIKVREGDLPKSPQFLLETSWISFDAMHSTLFVMKYCIDSNCLPGNFFSFWKLCCSIDSVSSWWVCWFYCCSIVCLFLYHPWHPLVSQHVLKFCMTVSSIQAAFWHLHKFIHMVSGEIPCCNRTIWLTSILR